MNNSTLCPRNRGNHRLREANEALRSLDVAKTHFFNNASHELRTPLMLVLGPLEQVLAERHVLPAATVELLDLALRNALRMQKLVSGLLDFARIEAGAMRPIAEPIDLVTLTRDIVESFRPVVERAGLRLTTTYGALPSVAIDPAQWEKILLNLLSNALKFTVAGEIAVTLGQIDGTAQLMVADTGSGIPLAETPRVFERFYQVPGRVGRSVEGTGIGLALVKELISLMGGSIRVESEVGLGSRFYVLLPLGQQPVPRPQSEPHERLTLCRAYAAEAAAWNGSSPSEAVPPDSGQPRHRPCVLVVDDNADMRTHLSHLLATRFVVTMTETAEKAWLILERDQPDLIITDIMLPGLDGLEFVRHLRQHERWKTIPILVLTARAEESVNIAGFESGADDFLVKPFSGHELMARVDAHIKLSHVRNQAAERERALREEAEHGRRQVEAIIAGVTDGFALLNPEFRLLHLNEREAELLQRPVAELVNTVVWDSLPPYARAEIEPHLQRSLQCREPVVFHFHDRERDLWFEKRAYVVDRGIAVFTVDITARRQGEKISAAKHQITRTLSEAPQLGAAAAGLLKHLREALDADVACFWLKRQDAELLELAYSDPVDKSPALADFIAVSGATKHAPGETFPGRVWVGRRVTWSPELQSDQGFTRKAAARAAGLVSGIGVPVAIEDEMLGVLELFLTRRYVPADPVLRLFESAGSEISQFVRRRRAEAEQRRLTSIIHSANDAILAVTVDGIVTSWNSGAERLYGYSAAEVIGRAMDRVVPPERRSEIREARERVARGERIEPFETVRVRKDGVRVDVFLSLSPLMDESDRVVGISAIGRDISAQKRAEAVERQNRDLQEANRRAVEASELKSTFLANMSHELRTPLHGIIGFSEFLVDEKVGPLNETQKEFLNDVLTSARHLLRLINNVLDISKVEAGHLELFPETLVLADLIREVCTIVRPLAEKQSVALHVPSESAAFEVTIDPLRLRQVLFNLLANAVEYNRPQGSVTVDVKQDHGSQFQVAVIDTGIGMRAADVETIFDDFRQLPTANRGKGSGLGLAVTKRLVECMQGRIEVESEAGRGSRFTVTFPVIAHPKECEL